MTLGRERLEASVWRLPLPSRTLPPYDHTNSYLLCAGCEGVLVDVGTNDVQALQSLSHTLSDLGVTRLRALLLTHTHPDHCAGAEAVRRSYSVPVYVHPLEQTPLPFPTERLAGGDVLEYGDGLIRAHHTPGHSPGHMSFEVEHTLLVGDLLGAQGSSWVGLPGGDLSAYLASLDAMANLVTQRTITVLAPGHGPVVTTPSARLGEVRAHRLEREAEVLLALERPRTLEGLRSMVYPELPEAAVPAAEGSLLAQLEKLIREGRASAGPSGYFVRHQASAGEQ